jgi:hypothetical protein
LNLSAGLWQGFTQGRKVRKEGQSEAALFPLRSLRTLRLGVKPSGAAAWYHSFREFKLYHYPTEGAFWGP